MSEIFLMQLHKELELFVVISTSIVACVWWVTGRFVMFNILCAQQCLCPHTHSTYAICSVLKLPVLEFLRLSVTWFPSLKWNKYQYGLFLSGHRLRISLMNKHWQWKTYIKWVWVCYFLRLPYPKTAESFTLMLHIGPYFPPEFVFQQ